MKSTAPVAKDAGFRIHALRTYHLQTGQSALVWALIALANLVFQGVLYFEMAWNYPRAGEFGLFNCALGIIGLFAVPVIALQTAFQLYPALPTTPGDAAERARSSSTIVVESLTWLWGIVCFVLLLIPLPLPYFPRFSLELLVLMNVLIALGTLLSRSICEGNNQPRRWFTLLVAAAFTRVVLAIAIGVLQPWAEAALGVVLLAGFITFGPALQPRDVDWTTRFNACRAALNRDFLVYAGATCSVFLGIYLFTNGDRIAALRWADFMPAYSTVIGVEVHRNDFDSYQFAGLLARGLLWGTQPLLWVLYADRVGLKKTTSASLRSFWVYLSVLIVGALLLGLLTEPWPNTPLVNITQKFGPTFAAIAIPLGLLQGLGIFSLASNRIPECYTLGICGVAYALVLAIFGNRPDLMLPLMFGLSLIAMMIVLFVGVVRWGRKQP